MRRQGIPVSKLARVSKAACGVLSMVVVLACVDTYGLNMSSRPQPAQAAQKRDDTGPAAHLHADDRIGDLLNHSAFAGFARLTLPWDNRDYDDSMRLRDMATLLPFHTYVNPDVVVIRQAPALPRRLPMGSNSRRGDRPAAGIGGRK